MKNFDSKERMLFVLECVFMIVMSSGLILWSFYMLVLSDHEQDRMVGVIVVGINIPILFYWMKQLIEL